MGAPRFLVLGAGYAGSEAARLARSIGREVTVTVRSEDRARVLRGEGFTVLSAPSLGAGIAAQVDSGTQVLVAFQPDPDTDCLVASMLRKAQSVVYLSSTGVYGGLTGVIDDDTLLPLEADERARKILDAEARYRSVGATVLRCPGIYGPDRGLHVRILKGEHQIPGDGEGFLSRIHVADLAQFVITAAESPQETFVVGDAEPARHIDVVRFVCDAYRVPLPARVPEGSVHRTLRANRRVDASRAIRRLGVTLRYPSYREGMSPGATGIVPGSLSIRGHSH